MEDLIERARAIEIIHELQDTQTFDQTADMAYDLVDWAISEIPSAQPEQRLSCKNCVHLGHGYMMPCKNCKRNQMLPDWYEVETERKKND